MTRHAHKHTGIKTGYENQLFGRNKCLDLRATFVLLIFFIAGRPISFSSYGVPCLMDGMTFIKTAQW